MSGIKLEMRVQKRDGQELGRKTGTIIEAASELPNGLRFDVLAP